MKSVSSRLVSVVLNVSILSTIFGTTSLAQANITVTNLADSGPGSLRQAIADAAPGETVKFAVTGTITLTTGQLVVDKPLTIIGPGSKHLKISGNNACRVFHTRSFPVTISALTITDGRAFNYGYPDSNVGGGIYNIGDLVLTDCIITNCTCTNYGSGIFTMDHSLTMSGCAVIGNSGGGGALWIDTNGAANSVNCTFSGNSCYGVYNYQGYVVLKNCTITSNSGGISQEAVSLTIQNTICADNFGWDCLAVAIAPIVSNDYNLIGTSHGFPITGATQHNIYGHPPLLGPLADLGGPTPTHALRFDSPALDAGSSSGLSTDQRGFSRPIDSPDVANAEGGDGSDIGAYEVNPLTQMAIFTAIEVEFGTTLGRTYRVESSTDMVTWTQVEAGIVGTGGPLTRLYTTRAIPKRFFQAVQE